MSHLVFQPRFYKDVEAIWQYIAMDHIHNADAWVLSLDRTLERLASQPRMGKVYPGLQIGIRGHPIGDYLILYKALKTGIEVFRIIHSARDLKKAWID
ncbi:MAG: type II toxin-antitoxin system RelE/ParE family toxin [Magnetococcales bacterium]|nr:type II toxin-antitoxin system RelE/ParE family toxin [Magnetococcales bacterium]MBF0437854.1 type II toxin-antitoxin system RelE/ParE family toxin [Magnetococcales bacterium]